MTLTNRDYNYLFVSDLHLSEGQDPLTGRLSRNEDFFYDDAFADFLVYHIGLGQQEGDNARFQRPWKLVINGDIFDFLQVTTPPAEEEREEALGTINFSPNKQEYGLGTSSRETVWKLGRIVAGHPRFFQALGWFLAARPENELLLLKGNHDIEIFWPAVKRRLRQVIGEGYESWQAEQAAGLDPDSPLPRDGILAEGHQWPQALTDLDQRVHFPAWYYYEPSLFYAEHGNQYDPANAFIDFLNPVLREDPPPPEDEKQVKLPSGSFFVRYFFNKVEQIHPFADNIKPLTRYLRWSFTKEPAATARMLVNNLPKLWRIMANLREKGANPVEGQQELQESLKQPEPQSKRSAKAPPPGARLLSLDRARRDKIDLMRQEHLKEASGRSRNVARGTAVGLAVNGSQYYWLASALRAFNDRAYGRMLRHLVLVGASFVGGTLLSRLLDTIDNYVGLDEVGRKVANILNAQDEKGESAAVPYHLFGHDHHPDLQPLEVNQEHAPPFRQWYVNTGSWLSSFDEQARLTRGDVQFTFFRLLPDPAPRGHDHLSALLEWLPRRQAVRSILLFGSAGEAGFEVAVEDIPEVRA